jgi:hypothetical protein
MSWSRAKYDDCTYKHNLKETVGAGEYMTQTPKVCSDCIVLAPAFGLHGRGASAYHNVGNMIDVDSELMGITKKYSQCPTQKFLPGQNGFPSCPLKTYKECIDLVPEPTLISNPKCTNKETTINRWEWLCKNPQDNVIPQFDNFINNRSVVKDNHRPLIERPINQQSALPPAENDCVKYDWASKWMNGGVFPMTSQLAPCGNIDKL